MRVVNVKVEDDNWVTYSYKMTYAMGWHGIIFFAKAIFPHLINPEVLRAGGIGSDFKPIGVKITDEWDLLNIEEGGALEIRGLNKIYDNAPFQFRAFNQTDIVTMTIRKEYLDSLKRNEEEFLNEDEKLHTFDKFMDSIEVNSTSTFAAYDTAKTTMDAFTEALVMKENFTENRIYRNNKAGGYGKNLSEICKKIKSNGQEISANTGFKLDGLMKLMDTPQDMPKEEFLKQYGAEKVFKLFGYNSKKDKWNLSHSPKYNDTWSEGVYFTYEDAASALMMRNVDCPLNKWVIKQTTVKEEFENPWIIRFIRNDGKILATKQDGDTISMTVYAQDELLSQFMSKYNRNAVISENIYKDMSEIYADDIILWVLAKPNTAKETAKWSFRKTYKYKKDGPYNGESCYHMFSTYEEALKESEAGYYPQKVTLYQELSSYTDMPHILYCGDKEVLIVPKKMYKAEPAYDVRDQEPVPQKAPEDITGTFTVMSRMFDAEDDVWSNGPVECDNLIDAMATRLGFLVGAPAEIAKATLKDEDIQKTRNNLLSQGRDRISNDEEESWIHYRPAGGRKTGGAEAVAAALNILNRDKGSSSREEKKIPPEDVLKYNALQKKMGGIPLDPLGSEAVCRALNAIITTMKENYPDKMSDIEWINGAIEYMMRGDGPWSELTGAERDRVISIVKDYFSPSETPATELNEEPSIYDDPDIDIEHEIDTEGLIKKLTEIISANYNMSDKVAKDEAEHIAQYPDIAFEFIETSSSGEYGTKVTAAGYTAQKVKEMAGDRLSHIGVYNYLITLRESPEWGIEMLNKGLPRK